MVVEKSKNFLPHSLLSFKRDYNMSVGTCGHLFSNQVSRMFIGNDETITMAIDDQKSTGSASATASVSDSNSVLVSVPQSQPSDKNSPKQSKASLDISVPKVKPKRNLRKAVREKLETLTQLTSKNDDFLNGLNYWLHLAEEEEKSNSPSKSSSKFQVKDETNTLLLELVSLMESSSQVVSFASEKKTIAKLSKPDGPKVTKASSLKINPKFINEARVVCKTAIERQKQLVHIKGLSVDKRQQKVSKSSENDSAIISIESQSQSQSQSHSKPSSVSGSKHEVQAKSSGMDSLRKESVESLQEIGLKNTSSKSIEKNFLEQENKSYFDQSQGGEESSLEDDSDSESSIQDSGKDGPEILKTTWDILSSESENTGTGTESRNEKKSYGKNKKQNPKNKTFRPASKREASSKLNHDLKTEKSVDTKQQLKPSKNGIIYLNKNHEPFRLIFDHNLETGKQTLKVVS